MDGIMWEHEGAIDSTSIQSKRVEQLFLDIQAMKWTPLFTTAC